MAIVLSEIFDVRSIRLNIEAATKEQVFTDLIDAMGTIHPEYNRDEIFAAMQAREAKMSTGIAPGVAIPHAFCRGVGSMIGAIGVSPAGIDYGALDDKPVHVVFMLAIGEPAKESHLRILNQIFTLVQSEALGRIKNARSAQELHTILCGFH
jgi:mannitol/fructose-specific phosphotransferase system IIA component (Ntr-type)